MTIDSTDTPENECSEHEVCLGDITCDENFDTFLCRSFLFHGSNKLCKFISIKMNIFCL